MQEHVANGTEDLEKGIIRVIEHFIENSHYNVFPEINGHYYETPIVQFAAADNPLFEQYKTIIGPYHLSPKERLKEALPHLSDPNGTVISIVLPISKRVRERNRAETRFGSREWALTRYYGDEILLDQVVAQTVAYLNAKGYFGMAPARAECFQNIQEGRNISSNWSERHIAYAAGLGTFSINDAFITEKGIAVKMVSVLTDAVIPQSEQRYQHYRENCLQCNAYHCGACMKRCPVGAITPQGHHKIKCYFSCYGEDSQKIAVAYGGKAEFGSGCGLCQTGVPCEYQIPVKSK
ncbi:MAG: epoxyqueuosine reductase [Clostridiales bacterium]|jgi:ferredoxin|nr:epoxyqueuosine reductase [Clostridiales bacterium]